MTLQELLRGVRVVSTEGELSLPVSHLTADSRQVQPGSLFLACQGAALDGHAFIPQAVAQGAAAILSERPFDASGPCIKVQVADGREAIATLAAHFYGDPAQKLVLIGITGTNGKTTVSYLIQQILQDSGAGRIGTVDYQIGSRRIPSHNTTPGPLVLQELLAQMVREGLRYAVMEISSHALDQKRTFGLPFHVGVFTNFSQDHLDYHADLESYFETKLKLFRSLSAEAWAVVNRDDGRSGRVVASTQAQLLTYGLDAKAMVYPEELLLTGEGVSFQVRSPFGSHPIRSGLVGLHNVYNLLAAIGAGLAQQIPLEQMARSLRSFEGVPGRLEPIRMGQPFEVFVDYAHTEEALCHVLRALRPYVRCRLIVVFGCGGDRDAGKRPKMGRAASKGADWVIVTSDNPRSEDPFSILREILSGFPSSFKAYQPIEERGAAIERALEMAQEGDVVLIAGKGHETVQILKDRTVPFDDRQVARDFLSKRTSSVSRVI